MCGLCTPSCPTYQISKDENLSPRGRISLIQALAQNKIDYSDKIKPHLESCLQCMSCQNICPSQVEYAEIIAYGQEVIFSHTQKSQFSLSAMNQTILTNHKAKSLFITLTNFLIRTHLLKLLKFFTKNSQFKSISFLPEKINRNININRKNSPQVIIFAGCANTIFDSEILKHSYELLKSLSIENLSIDDQNCCGAIYRKEGNTKSFNTSVSKISQKYSDNEILVSLNSSCSASLISSVNNNGKNIRDIISFLAIDYYQLLKSIQFKPLASKVYFHQSCTMTNHLKTQKDCLKLLNLIPDIEIKTHIQSCCGASGNYMLTHVHIAEQIAIPLIDFIIIENIHIMISTDISCSLHIKQQLEKQNYHLEVLHPISLLYRQLKSKI